VRTGNTAKLATHLADALVQIAVEEPDLVIIALGTWPSTRTSLSALHAVAPGLEILFTGSFADDESIEAVLNEGACYMQTISQACIESFLARRVLERARRKNDHWHRRTSAGT
jgi:hypothetical protein